MIGEIQYGGRVTDDYDKRLLNTYARVSSYVAMTKGYMHLPRDYIVSIPQLWFSENMFKPNFKFYKGYGIPVHKTINDYLDYIDSLPLVDTPELFGLHPNADIT